MRKKQFTALLVIGAMMLQTLTGCSKGTAATGSSTAKEANGGIKEFTAFFAVPEMKSMMTMKSNSTLQRLQGPK